MADQKKRICAVIPAAGKGTRLGLDVPKILTPVTPTKKIWNILCDKLLDKVAHIHLILSPTGLPLLQHEITREGLEDKISLSIQPEPLGMGDAIFGAEKIWRDFSDILVIWGDQVNLSSHTITQTLQTQSEGASPSVTLPVTTLENPYVQYMFDAHGQLTHIRESREGHACDPQGESDVGTFALSVTGLADSWAKYLRLAKPGLKTGEFNFLPFLPYLSTHEGLKVKRVTVADALEARGVNTPADLEFFKELYSKKGVSS